MVTLDLKTRELVDRAKGILMDRNGMSERDALSFIQRTAMDRRARVTDVATEIIDGTTAP